MASFVFFLMQVACWLPCQAFAFSIYFAYCPFNSYYWAEKVRDLLTARVKFRYVSIYLVCCLRKDSMCTGDDLSQSLAWVFGTTETCCFRPLPYYPLEKWDTSLTWPCLLTLVLNLVPYRQQGQRSRCGLEVGLFKHPTWPDPSDKRAERAFSTYWVNRSLFDLLGRSELGPFWWYFVVRGMGVGLERSFSGRPDLTWPK